MRHRVVKTKLSRDLDHRKALLRNLATSLFEKDKIETTLAKAKFVQPYAETLITKAIKTRLNGEKINKFNTVKDLSAILYTEESIKRLLDDIASRYESAKGGYTRIVMTGNRDGDNAKMARIELVKLPVAKKPKKIKEAVEKVKEEKEETK